MFIKLLNLKNKHICSLKKLDKLTKVLAKKIIIPNIILLNGDLGSGKTTFVRYLIKNLFLLSKTKPPKYILSPSFSLLQIYKMKNYKIYHYDLYRVNNSKELIELNFEENLIDNLTIIEWPQKIIKHISNYNSINIQLSVVDDKKRKIIIK